MPIVAPATPGECFDYAIEAWRLALKYMTPVVYLSDAFLATGAEPWRIPDVADLPDIARRRTAPTASDVPARTRAIPTTLARPWAVPGTPGLEHRIGGLEKADITGNVSYDPDNHHRMQLLRQAKVAGIADDIPPLEVYGPRAGDLLILGWGSTYGAIRSAVERLQAEGWSVAHAHLRHLNPFPANTDDVLRSYRRVLIPEVNLGQLLDAASGRATWSTPSATTRSAASRSASPRSSEEAERAARRGDAMTDAMTDGADRRPRQRRRRAGAQPGERPGASR